MQHFFAFSLVTQSLFALERPIFKILNFHLFANGPTHLKVLTHDISFTKFIDKWKDSDVATAPNPKDSCNIDVGWM